MDTAHFCRALFVGLMGFLPSLWVSSGSYCRAEQVQSSENEWASFFGLSDHPMRFISEKSSTTSSSETSSATSSDSTAQAPPLDTEPTTLAPILSAAMLQPQPAITPQQEAPLDTLAPTAATQLSVDLFGGGPGARSILGSNDQIFGLEATARVTTDAGNLLGKSPSALGVGVQRRTPIVNDPRIRGSRVGQLAASGSHWVPARIDLDTMLSKIDSRIIEDIVVIKGPYSVFHGPEYRFTDVQLLDTPRYANGPEGHGSSSLDYKTNGEQWYGRQTVWGGDADWGFRVGYGHRTGNDYTTGNGTEVPASYNSRDFDVALGYDLSPEKNFEFKYLRMDQSDVEFPGQAFDFDFLVTDGFELGYVAEDQCYYDRLSCEVWYNRTRFEGNAQNPGKRHQFPFLNNINYTGFTDVDSMSTGFQLATTWGQPDEKHWTTGVDLRYLKQELNEIATGQLGFNFFQNANSPIPRSDSLDPGIFVERAVPINERLNIKAGTRMDFVSTAVIDDPQKLQTLGLQNPQYSLADTLGTDQFDQSFSLWGAHITGEYKLKPCCMLTGSVGYAERPPTLTELYVAESFLFLLQNGLNTATGDPLLDPEQALQFDLGLAYTGELCRFGVNGFYSHIHDYITFENLESDPLPPFGHRDQTNLKYVNTNLASLAGVETYAECEATCWLTPFATLKFVEGRDHTRNGNFATRQVSSGNPSERVSGAARGSFSGIPGADKEPLPNILPLETQLGFRFHPAGAEPTWSVELSARVVDNQDRIATSLLESPTSGFTIYNIRGYWQARKQLLLVAGIENFTDKNYREHLDFRSPSGYQLFQPGIIFYSGMEYKY